MTQFGLPDGYNLVDPSAPMPGLDALLVASLRDCPDAILFRDDDGAVTARTVTGQVHALAAQFRLAGLRRGERLLLVMGARTTSLVALIAALRAGLEPALVPCGLGPVELAAHILAVEAVALVGPTHYGSLALGDSYLSAAALSDTIRLVATLGPDEVDGAADFSPAALGRLNGAVHGGFEAESPILHTFEEGVGTPAPLAHRQASLFAAALSLVDQARINPSKAVLSTIAPATLAGLVAGPFAALIGASSLVLHGPFDARAFLAAHDAEPGAHLIAPAEIGLLLRDAGLTDADAALVLLSRFASPSGFIPPSALRCDCLVVDLYAFGEGAVLAQRRIDGAAQTPSEIHDGSLPGRLGVALNRARADSRAMAANGD